VQLNGNFNLHAQEVAMSLEENKAVARRWIEEAWSQGNLDVVDELIHPNHSYRDYTALHRHHPDYDQSLSDAFHGPEGQKALINMYRSAFPDMQFTVVQEIAEGDLVVNVADGRMTQRGEFMGIPPTGKQAEVQAVSIVRVANGQIQQYWLSWNSLSVLHQLGARVVPPQQAGS
jgi:predicted ester cyclase